MLKLFTTRLQYKLIVAFLLVLVVPTFFVGMYDFPSTYNELIARSIDSSRTRNQVQALAIANTFNRAKPDATYLIQSSPVQSYASAVIFGDSSEISAALTDVSNSIKAYLLNLPEYDSMALLDVHGTEVVRVRYFDGGPIVLLQDSLQARSRTDYFQQASTLSDGQVYASPVSLNVEDNQIEQPFKPIIHFSTPLYATNGKIVGVIVTNLLASTFLSLVTGNTPNETAYLIDATDGTYLAGPDGSKLFARDFRAYKAGNALPSPLPSGNFLVDHPHEGLTLLAAENGANFGSQDAPGLQQVYTRIIIPDFPQIHWTLYHTEPTSEILGSIYRQLGTTAVLLSVAVLLAFLVAFAFTRSIVGPIQELARLAGSISEGNWSGPQPAVKTQDEIGQLANAFSKMARELKDIYDTLDERVRQRTAELETVVQVSATTTSILDLDQLLHVVVDLTKERFNLYHARIFLLKEDGETLVMAAGTNEARSVPSDQQHSISSKTDNSLAAWAVRTRQIVIENNLTSGPDSLMNPKSANPYSELAVLMSIGDRIIGVLDVQSDKPNFFTSQDVKVLTALAEQVAIAVRNAQLFAQAQIAQSAAEQANRVKSLFLANISHELRTPLNAIINFTLFIKRGNMGPVTKEQVDALTKVYTSAKHLLGLINDVLDISKIEAGSMELYIEDDVHIEEEIETAIVNTKNLLEGKPVNLINTVLGPIPPIRGDRQRILQIILNVLSNACKFTDKGEIKIMAHQENGAIVVSIKDTGPGIALEEQPAIFTIFKQGEAGLQRGGGTGLGMSISKRLAEAHGGRMWLESRKGEGSTFFVAIPVRNEKLQSTE